MFEEVDPVGYDAWLVERAAALDLIAEDEVYEPLPELAAAELAEWEAELSGSQLPSASEVIAAGEHEAVTPALVGRLAAIDPMSLDDDARVGLAVCWARVRNYADAMAGRAIAIQIAATTAVGGPKDVLRRSAEELATAELGAALRLDRAAASSLVFVADTLARRLSATNAEVAKGGVSWAKAATLAHATVMLSTEQARKVEAKVLPFAASRTPSQHSRAVRRWVDRVDPAGAEERRRQAREDVRLVVMHGGDGVGQLFARMPSEQLDTVWAGADHWARRRKDAGDSRTLDQLRVAALVTWASSFLVHGEGSYCDTVCDPVPEASAETAPTPPTRHGRPALVRLVWDMTSLLGVTNHCGELLDSGETLPPEAMRENLAAGLRVRRMLIDPATGELVDLTPQRWTMSPDDPDAVHLPPVELGLVLDTALHAALTTGDVTDLSADQRALVRAVTDALGKAPTDLRQLLSDLLAAPITAEGLDDHPDAYPPRADLAEFVALRDRHPTNPTAGASSAAAADLDHIVSERDGGPSTRDNLHSPTRRWHVLKTHAGWTVTRTGRGWTWTSPTGRRYFIEPYDYRLGP